MAEEVRPDRRDAWIYYDFARELSVPQYLTIAALVCGGFLEKGAPSGPHAWHSAKTGGNARRI
jgi:predicted TIM-barrel fold metal-dependent hydrolase